MAEQQKKREPLVLIVRPPSFNCDLLMRTKFVGFKASNAFRRAPEFTIRVSALRSIRANHLNLPASRFSLRRVISHNLPKPEAGSPLSSRRHGGPQRYCDPMRLAQIARDIRQLWLVPPTR